MQRRRRLRRVAIPNSQALSLLGRDLREAHLQVLLGGSGYRSSNANSSNAVTDPFLSSLILNFPSSKSKDILKSVLSSADDSSVKSVTSSHIWKASFDPSLSYEEREKRKRQAVERAVFLQDLLVSTLSVSVNLFFCCCVAGLLLCI
ncbi:protein DEHYDRATION-INDUCED 19-like [Camellia sinensis]|uniref:protein DEHYDRATION-INDUCED 19-like n=1 Tax=Camellia sinensis TaxID=4442 RepID=UPI0010365D8B|nr:protein DEHYDRATION-INDUCED 19-like [Camellia sinensis]